MKYQILRRPVRYMAGVLMILVAVATLCVTGSQSMYARLLVEKIENEYVTVAVPSLEIQKGGNPKYDEITTFVNDTVVSRPDLVHGTVKPGVASAYIPGVAPLNYTNYYAGDHYCYCNFCISAAMPDGAPYCTAMLEVTLTGISGYEKLRSYYWDEAGIRLTLDGKVDRVVGLQEGYSDPTGFYIDIHLLLQEPYQEDWDMALCEQYLEKLGLVIGEKYLVYGAAYDDLDYRLRNEIAVDLNVEFPEELNPAYFTLYTYEHELGRYDDGNISYLLSGAEFHMYRRVALRIYYDENMQKLGGTNIVRLEGSTEELLASEAGAPWRDALARMEVNNHAFPIIGVDRLEHIAGFANGSAKIIQGRNFTSEELKTGAKVCVISYDLARANGIELGDTLSASFYTHEENVPYQQYLSNGNGVVRPSAYFYTAASEMEEPEGYTVVGIYNIKFDPWSYTVQSAYEFTPNTIFVPKSSVSVPLEEPGQGMFYVVELENGAIGAFEELAVQSGLIMPFGYFDGGYSAIAPSVEMFRETASRAMLVGVTVYGILLLLYLLLFPAQEKSVLRTMNSLGAPWKTRFTYLLTTVLGTLLPGTLLGMGLGAALWGFVAQNLLEHSGSAFTVELNATQFVLVGISQLVLALLLSAVLALCMTKRSDLMRRK